MLKNMQICRTRGRAAGKEDSRKIRGSRMFGNSKKEGNHEPSEDKAIINESVEFIYHSR
jgi:hypothetical protein